MSSSNQIAPPPPPAKAAWLYKNGSELSSITVDYQMLGVDTSKTVWHVEFFGGKKQTVDEQGMSEFLNFYPHPDVPSHRAIAALKRNYVAMCEAREKWEKSNAREIAEYERLKKKFEGTP
jgi:hypothetical protein